MHGNELSDEFWEFSLSVYPRRGVRDAVLHLQDTYHADVNLLLFLCFVAAAGHGRVEVEQIDRLDASVRRWRADVTAKLRATRRNLKTQAELMAQPGAPEVYQKVLEAEVASERVTQTLLCQAFTPAVHSTNGTRLADGVTSLRRYFRRLEIRPDTDAMHALATLVSAAFDISAGDAASAIGNGLECD